MASYKRSAVEELEALPKETVKKIVVAVEKLVDNPHPYGNKKLAGTEDVYRIRVGNYRVISASINPN